MHEKLLCPARVQTGALPAPVVPSGARAQLCDDCGFPLHPAAAADGSTVHPTCAPVFPPAPRPIPATPQPAAAASIPNLFDR
jgi:hypothetical protein